MADDTMIRVKTVTRDRLMALAAADFGGTTADEALQALMDEHWKTMCIAQADRWRTDHPEEWQEYLRESELWDRQSPSVTAADGAYESDDPDWIARGGAPLTKVTDAA